MSFENSGNHKSCFKFNLYRKVHYHALFSEIISVERVSYICSELNEKSLLKTHTYFHLRQKSFFLLMLKYCDKNKWFLVRI